jgi:hypothetical protein
MTSWDLEKEKKRIRNRNLLRRALRLAPHLRRAPNRVRVQGLQGGGLLTQWWGPTCKVSSRECGSLRYKKDHAAIKKSFTHSSPLP